ncbi:MAG TPA: type II toxin-antitoxin system VapC family toxin [Candidatus Acidoferrales bacterium]|jgi:PIN domain nuclease of toxin-antitoxin system|nr:type II toxin-antitoxin system VapC family toxin [Candidatus Acidoferrales bacterium]
MRLLLDTAAFIWAASSPEKLSRAAMSAMRSESAVREISAVSLSEIAIKQSIGKLAFDKNDVATALADLQVRVLAFTAEHAFRLFDLPLYHPDPFDRQIIAQALSEEVAVVTSDEKFRLYEGIKVVW